MHVHFRSGDIRVLGFRFMIFVAYICMSSSLTPSTHPPIPHTYVGQNRTLITIIIFAIYLFCPFCLSVCLFVCLFVKL